MEFGTTTHEQNPQNRHVFCAVLPMGQCACWAKPGLLCKSGIAMSHDGGCRLVIALALLSVVPVALGAGTSCVIADGRDGPRLRGLLGSRVAPSHYLLACGLRFLIGGFLRK
jgi:hypothetical protein